MKFADIVLPIAMLILALAIAAFVAVAIYFAFVTNGAIFQS